VSSGGLSRNLEHTDECMLLIADRWESDIPADKYSVVGPIPTAEKDILRLKLAFLSIALITGTASFAILPFDGGLAGLGFTRRLVGFRLYSNGLVVLDVEVFLGVAAIWEVPMAVVVLEGPSSHVRSDPGMPLERKYSFAYF
jgi:hypothetical protein